MSRRIAGKYKDRFHYGFVTELEPGGRVRNIIFLIPFMPPCMFTAVVQVLYTNRVC